MVLAQRSQSTTTAKSKDNQRMNMKQRNKETTAHAKNNRSTPNENADTREIFGTRATPMSGFRSIPRVTFLQPVPVLLPSSSPTCLWVSLTAEPLSKVIEDAHRELVGYCSAHQMFGHHSD